MQNGINERSGVFLAIEDNKKHPSIVSKVVSVMPGTETNIALQGKEIKRMRSPFESNCTNEYKDKRIKDVFGSNFAYSTKICTGTCYALKFYDACGCIFTPVIEGPMIEAWFRYFAKGTRICNVTQGSEDYVCFGYIKVSNQTECGCNPECSKIRYGVKP